MSKTVTTEETRPWTNIDYTNTSAYRTVKNWNKMAGIYEKGGQGGEAVIGGIPRDEYQQLKRLRKLDAVVKPEKGSILKEITHMSRMIVKTPDSKGRMVSKEVLTVQGQFKGTDWSDMEVQMTFTEGFGKYPILGKVYKSSARFNSETGEDLGTIDVKGSKIEYFFEVPSDAKQRKKYIDSFIENANGSYPENILYYYKDLGGGNAPNAGRRDGTFSYEQFTNLSIESFHLSYQ